MEALPGGHAVWVAEPLVGPEQALRFHTTGGRELHLACNLPYELWLDGRYAGDGGHRCVPGEALADAWPQAAAATEVVVRVHWLDPTCSGFSGRLPFPDPFLADLERGAAVWTRAEREAGLRFGVRASGHLARQTWQLDGATEPLSVTGVERPGWSARRGAIAASRYVPLALEPVADRLLPALGEEPFDPAGWAGDACWVGWVTERRPALRCRTYDLGAIALHRFELDAPDGPALLCGSEVGELERLTTEGRGRVALADAAAGGQVGVGLLGQRGCRYVHLFSEPGEAPVLRAWRREYPLRWRALEPAAEDAPLLAAARANLVACVDGGLVDSCWRERVQWTGDARMAAIALRALADAPEVIDLALGQIATSYEPESGMVRAAWPSTMDVVIPTYHLAFCLAALEHDPALERDPRVRAAVRDSLPRWRARYLRDGLVTTPPGWTFTDWERGALETMGYAVPEGAPHALLCAWWAQVCARRGEPSGVDVAAFEACFACGDGYALVPRDARARAAERGPHYQRLPQVAPTVSPHATAAAVAAGLAQGARGEGALDWLEAAWRSGELRARVTPYFGYVVAEALEVRDPALARAFVRAFYGEEARALGTISEKGSPADSLAHGWSVAYARFLTPRG